MIDPLYTFPIILSALIVLATILNYIAHFSNGEYLSWKRFNKISLITLLSIAACTFAWMIYSRASMFSSLQLIENKSGNMILTISASMFIVYQECILFRNVLNWIGRNTSPINLSYSAYAILIPLIVMIIKIPFSSPLDIFPNDNMWGALCFEFGFWHFITALSLTYAVIMIIIQFVQFVTLLRHHGKSLLLISIIYFPVMLSLFILSMYAVLGVILLFIIRFVLSIIEEGSKTPKNQQ